MGYYRKKPVVVEALQWKGDNEEEMGKFASGYFLTVEPEDRQDDPDQTAEVFVGANGRWLPILTGEWVIKDEKGFYPCAPDIFEKTYEPV